MAKKSENDTRKGVLARIKRTEAYAERVRTLFAATVNEILALNKTMPELDEGEMFSFDSVGMKKQHEVERLLRQLHSVATMAIQSGIKLEWAAANAECDKLVKSCFGKKALETPEFTAWTQRNEAAMSAFIARSEKGLNLSQRVWKSCRQLRDEMEVAITVAVGDGTSAASMSRSVRKYLNDPDLMFRRFRYKDPETGEWKRKWKKRVIGEDGKVHFIDYDKDCYQDDWTGPGYYKSSAQNAMRVARTETNIAYRRADHERWQQMDFVLGQRVSLSHNHPKKDICDKLAGDYPPDFVFDGWHPQCFCMVTPILMDEDEIQKMNEAMLEGKEYKPRGKRITQYPENFKQWVRDNEDKILTSHDFGSDPYFVRNNFSAVQDILNPKKQLTPLEIAEQRHANRTPEQEEAIRLKWQERQERIAAEKQAAEAERLRIERINKTAQNVLKTATTRFADFDIDTVALEAAVQSGDITIINAETRALAQIMAKKQQQIKKTASNVIDVASKYKDFTVDTDAVTSLNDALKTGNLSAINAQTRALAQKIVELKQQTKAMSSIIPNAMQMLDQYTVSELGEAYREFNGIMQKWLSKYSYSSLENAPLEHLKNKLSFELTNPTIIYSQKEIIKKAITELIKSIEQRIEWENLISRAATLKSFKTRSTAYKNYLTQIDDAILRKDFVALKNSIAAAELQQQKLVDVKIKRGGDTKTALNKEYKGGAVGRDLASSIDVSKMTSEDPYSGTFTNNVARMQGFDAPAKLVSEAEFAMLEKVCGEVFYRTVNPTTFKGKKMSSKEFASQLYVAERLELNGPGGRVYGDGMYVATSAWNGRALYPLSDSRKQEGYESSVCYGNGNHTLLEMTWTRKPKIIMQRDLRTMWNKLSRTQQKAFGYNENTYACALGYDAMYCDGPNYMVVWNRSIIAVKNK